MSRLQHKIESPAAKKKRKTKDYDPEDEPSASENESNSDSEQGDVNGGREHYEKVEKSRLRQPESLPINPKYSGVVVSRSQLAADVDDFDPFADVGSDGSVGSDPFAEDGTIQSQHSEDGLQPVLQPKGIKHRNEGGRNRSEQDREEEEEEEKEDDDDDDVSSNSDNEEMRNSSEGEISNNSEEGEEEDDDDNDTDSRADMSSEEDSRPNVVGKRAELRAHLSQQTKSLASGFTQAAHSDVRKGQSVKAQYQTFDRLLDARIKLQKGVVASETLQLQPTDPDFAESAERAIHEAQQAALELYNTIGSFRDRIRSASVPVSDSRKRKRSTNYDSLEDLHSIWTEISELEKESQISRDTIINKWSNKVKTADPTRMAATSKPRFLDPDSQAHDDRISVILHTYVVNEQDKVLRALTTGVSQSAHSLYDDNPLYQSLLRDLITTRQATSTAAQNISSSVLPQKLHPSGNRQNKKTIDTKASKGRKIRYTVHEKLQNFMAAEGDTGRDTAMWTERGKNEFFGSLFGQDRALIEDEDDDEEMDDQEVDANAEADALRLFST